MVGHFYFGADRVPLKKWAIPPGCLFACARVSLTYSAAHIRQSAFDNTTYGASELRPRYVWTISSHTACFEIDSCASNALKWLNIFRRKNCHNLFPYLLKKINNDNQKRNKPVYVFYSYYKFPQLGSLRTYTNLATIQNLARRQTHTNVVWRFVVTYQVRCPHNLISLNWVLGSHNQWWQDLKQLNQPKTVQIFNTIL